MHISTFFELIICQLQFMLFYFFWFLLPRITKTGAGIVIWYCRSLDGVLLCPHRCRDSVFVGPTALHIREPSLLDSFAATVIWQVNGRVVEGHYLRHRHRRRRDGWKEYHREDGKLKMLAANKTFPKKAARHFPAKFNSSAKMFHEICVHTMQKLI